MPVSSTEIIILPRKNIFDGELRESWNFRELLYFFVWRNLKVRYKQAVIGVAWIMLQPFINMIVFSIFFGMFTRIPTDGVPYPVFVFSGLLIWQFFSSILSEVSNTFVDNAAIISKIYFPRIILPISVVMTRLVDLAVASLILVGLMIYYGYAPRPATIIVLPLILTITAVSAFGVGIFLSSINVKYRDIRQVVPFLIQLWLFATPVIYPTFITGKYAKFLALNPMTGVVEGLRSVLFGLQEIPWLLMLGSSAIAVAVLVLGTIYYRKTEARFVDIM